MFTIVKKSTQLAAQGKPNQLCLAVAISSRNKFWRLSMGTTCTKNSDRPHIVWRHCFVTYNWRAISSAGVIMQISCRINKRDVIRVHNDQSAPISSQIHLRKDLKLRKLYKGTMSSSGLLLVVVGGCHVGWLTERDKSLFDTLPSVFLDHLWNFVSKQH